MDVKKVLCESIKFFICGTWLCFRWLASLKINMQMSHFVRVIISMNIYLLIIALKPPIVEFKPYFWTPMSRVKLCILWDFLFVEPKFFVSTWPQSQSCVSGTAITIPSFYWANHFTIVQIIKWLGVIVVVCDSKSNIQTRLFVKVEYIWIVVVVIDLV